MEDPTTSSPSDNVQPLDNRNRLPASDNKETATLVCITNHTLISGIQPDLKIHIRDTVIAVHRSMLAPQCVLFKYTSQPGFKEANEGVLSMHGDTKGEVDNMIDFLYTKTYRRESKHGMSGDAIDFDLAALIIGDKYCLEPLVDLAVKRICESFAIEYQKEDPRVDLLCKIIHRAFHTNLAALLPMKRVQQSIQQTFIARAKVPEASRVTQKRILQKKLMCELWSDLRRSGPSFLSTFPARSSIESETTEEMEAQKATLKEQEIIIRMNSEERFLGRMRLRTAILEGVEKRKMAEGDASGECKGDFKQRLLEELLAYKEVQEMANESNRVFADIFQDEREALDRLRQPRLGLL